MRCPRCDHPLQFCECLPPTERHLLEPPTLIVDLGWGRPYRIRAASPAQAKWLFGALLTLPFLLVSLPFVGLLAFVGHAGDPVCWHQVAGFVGGTAVAFGGAWLLPVALLRFLTRRSVYPERNTGAGGRSSRSVRR